MKKRTVEFTKLEISQIERISLNYDGYMKQVLERLAIKMKEHRAEVAIRRAGSRAGGGEVRK